MPELRLANARFALQNGVQDLRLFSELQRFLLILTTGTRRHGEIIRPVSTEYFELIREHDRAIVRLTSVDGTNILSLARINALLIAVQRLRFEAEKGLFKGLIITGNKKFFSAGADLKEISRLSGPEAFAFSRRGQELTAMLDHFPVPVTAVIRGYCMGGGMDLALACGYRMAAPNAVFGHRGASLGVLTGWGGTQRLPRLIGRTRALQMFLLAEMVPAEEALRIGLVDAISDDPEVEAQKFYSKTLPHKTELTTDTH